MEKLESSLISDRNVNDEILENSLAVPQKSKHRITMCAYASCFSHGQLFLTLRIVAHQAPLSMRFSRQEYCSGFLCPPPGDLPDPGIEPMSLMSPELAGGFLTARATYKAPRITICPTYSLLSIYPRNVKTYVLTKLVQQ